MKNSFEPFEHVVIVGCGLLGASLGLALHKGNLARRITGVGRRGSPSVETAKSRGAIDAATDDLAAAVAPADLVVVCTPVRQFAEVFKTIAPGLKPGAIVTDVGSTKTQVMQWAAEILPANATFVGSHPMAGSEKTGPEAAREDLYRGATCLLCTASSSENSPPASRVKCMWEAIGMRVIPCNAHEHDRWVASVSHLPHALAFSLMNAAGHDRAVLAAAAGGFTDMTRIAGSDATMWTDIFLTNRDAVVTAIEGFSAELAALKEAIEMGDEEAIRDALNSSKKTREEFMQIRGSRTKQEGL